MLDSKTKNILDLNDIKEVMVETMLNKYTDKELEKATIRKFFKYMELQQRNNTSRNSVDSRIESLYKAIQKEYDKFMKFNEILTELN